MRKFLTLFLLAMLSTSAFGNTSIDRGNEIAREMDRRDTGFVDQKSVLRMVLRNAQGQESIRKLRIFTKEGERDGDESITYFDEPADVKGTAMLTHTHKRKDDDQWLYLPALRRVKRISSSNRAGPFMGSEFAYEDLGAPELEKFTYRYLRDDAVDDIDCYVIDRYPVSRYSGYSRQEVWVDKKRYIALKINYYDRKNQLIKVLNMKKYIKHEGRFWRSHEMLMRNVNTGKSTSLLWKNYEFNTGFLERDFDTTNFSRMR